MKATPRFGQPSEADFYTLLKEVKAKPNPVKKLNKKEHHSKFNISKNEKSINSHEKLNLENPPHINKELIQRWFCDYSDKKFELRNDYDYEHSKKFLQEKEKAFEKIDFCDDSLLKNHPNHSN